MRGKTTAFFVGASMLLAGCHSLQIQSRTDPHTIATYAPQGGTRYSRRAANGEDDPDTCPLVATGRDDHRGAINLDCFRFLEAPKDTGREGLAYSQALRSIRDRNRLTAILMKQSDDICNVEMSQLRANEATLNTALSTLTTGFSAASTIVGGDLAKSILSGTASFMSGTQSHINVNVYRNQISEAVSQSIDVERDRLRKVIFERYKDDNEIWTVDDAIRSVNQYHGACSFYKGLQLLLMRPGQEKAVEHLVDALKDSRIIKAEEAEPAIGDGAKAAAKKVGAPLPKQQN